MKVYVCHIGEYEQRYAIAAFSTESAAKAMYKDQYPVTAGEQEDIDEFELDARPVGWAKQKKEKDA